MRERDHRPGRAHARTRTNITIFNEHNGARVRVRALRAALRCGR